MSHIVLTANVAEYRATIPHCVTAGDAALEIGCGWGDTSTLLNQHAAFLLAVDRGDSLPVARQRHPHIRFEHLDGHDIGRILRIRRAFDVVYIDISGSRPIPAVLAMVERHRAVFSPRCIVVKSSRLLRLFASCTVWSGARGGER